jgi:hypothetical protein
VVGDVVQVPPPHRAVVPEVAWIQQAGRWVFSFLKEQEMPGRGSQTFKKRQKEQQRKERQQEKMAQRLARKDQPPAAPSDDQDQTETKAEQQ